MRQVNSERKLIVPVIAVGIIFAAAGTEIQGVQVQCGPGYSPPGAGGCCDCAGFGEVRVSCGNASKCCPNSAMCKGASQTTGTSCGGYGLCSSSYRKDSRFDFGFLNPGATRIYTADLETAGVLQIATSPGFDYEIKTGVLQPAAAPDALVQMLDEAGDPIAAGTSAITMTKICGGQGTPSVTCEPQSLQPAGPDERWIEFRSQVLASDASPAPTPYALVAVWSERWQDTAVLENLNGRFAGGWVSHTQDDLYALPAADTFTSFQMSVQVWGIPVPVLGTWGLVLLTVALAAAGLLLLSRRLSMNPRG